MRKASGNEARMRLGEILMADVALGGGAGLG
jgi:hypothetical protein